MTIYIVDWSNGEVGGSYRKLFSDYLEATKHSARVQAAIKLLGLNDVKHRASVSITTVEVE